MIAIAIALMANSGSAHANPLDWATGYWGISPRDMHSEDYEDRNCSDSPVQIKINGGAPQYWSQIGEETPRTATISAITETGFTLEYDNETRRMDNGRLHIWHIEFIDADTFFWIRDDWKKDGSYSRTVRRYRCEMRVS